jgi:hypothetical protein
MEQKAPDIFEPVDATGQIAEPHAIIGLQHPASSLFHASFMRQGFGILKGLISGGFSGVRHLPFVGRFASYGGLYSLIVC